MGSLSLQIIKKDNTIAAAASAEEVTLVYSEAYEEGDRILVNCEKEAAYLMVQLDDAIGYAFLYLKNHQMSFTIPFGEHKICYSPKSFSGSRHLLGVRYAEQHEILSVKNLAKNPYDQHGNLNCFPHASANVETRGESVFAAKNAINGNRENHSHGEWPYESWGINQNPDARIKVDFARPVKADRIRMYTRADFPHDSWWKQVTLSFSDGSELVWALEKSDKAHELVFEEKIIEWVEMHHLIKAEDASPFPALSQFELYGSDEIEY
jgi:hypothetical protein